jgi:formylglycine-generating enzyme required for sulfatase activity
MIFVPGGETKVGSNEFKILNTGTGDAEDKKRLTYPFMEHDVILSGFKISKYEITVGQFKEFVNETDYIFAWQKEYDDDYVFFNQYTGKEKRPMEFISAFDALAFCQWYSKKTGKVYRLPTNAEWEYSAMGNTKKKFPWGEKSVILLSTNTIRVMKRDNFDVDQIIEDVSPFGVMGMYGGSEYLLDTFVEDYYSFSSKINPLSIKQAQNDYAISIRLGGSYNDLTDTMGMYERKDGDFGGWGRCNFRIVEDIGTIFNEGTDEECIFFQTTGYINNAKIKSMPTWSYDAANCINNKEVLILFKTENNNKTWYKVYYDELINMGDYSYLDYKSGWVSDDEIALTDKLWYNLSNE